MERYNILSWIERIDIVKMTVLSKAMTTDLMESLSNQQWHFSDSDGKESACSAGDPGSIPGSRRSPGEGNAITCQCSCLENSMDKGAWWATIYGVTELNMTEQIPQNNNNKKLIVEKHKRHQISECNLQKEKQAWKNQVP